MSDFLRSGFVEDSLHGADEDFTNSTGSGGCDCSGSRHDNRHHVPREPQSVRILREGARTICRGADEIERDFCCPNGRRRINEGVTTCERGLRLAVRELEDARCDLSCEGIREIRAGIREVEHCIRECNSAMRNLETCQGRDRAVRELRNGARGIERGAEIIDRGFRRTRDC